MQLFISIVIATISFVTLLIYYFLSLCRILKKEKFVLKVWGYLFSVKTYNEKILFIGIRPLILIISFLAYILSEEILSQVTIFYVLLAFAPILAIGATIVNLRTDN